MGNQIQQSILIVGTSSREIGGATEIVRSCGNPQGIDVIQNLLLEGLRHLLDEPVEINLARKHAVELLVNLDHLEAGGDRGLTHPAKALSTNALGAICSIGNSKQIAVLHIEQVLIAEGDIPVLHKGIKIIGSLQALHHSAGQDLLN